MATEVFALVGRIALDGAKRVTSGLKNIQDVAEKTHKKVKDFGEAIGKVGDGMTTAGENITTKLGGPLLALGGAAGIAANDMQNANSKIAAQLGLTNEEAQDLTNTAKDLWKNGFGESVADAAEGVSIVATNMRDLPAGHLQEIAEYAYTLRDAFGAELNESTRTADVLMANFGISAQRAFDIMTVGFQNGGNYTDELLDTLREYSPQFSNMGMTADEFMSVLINGAQNGAFNLDKVGDAVKEFNIRAKDGSETTKEGFKAIGLNAADMAKKIAAGGEAGKNAYTATIAALAKMEDPVKRNAAGVALFGTAWEDLEADVITSMGTTNDAMTGFMGATERAGDSLYNNFQTRATETFRTVLASLEPLGQKLLDVADKYLPKIESAAQRAADWFGKLSDKNQNLVLLLGGIGIALGPLLIIFGTFATAISGIIGLFTMISAPIWIWIAAIVAVGAALTALYLKSENFRRILHLVFNVTMQLVVGTFKYYWGLIQLIFQGAVNVIMGIINFFKAMATGNFSGMWAAIKQIFTGALQLIWAYIQLTLLGRVMKIFGSLASGAARIIGGMGSRLLGLIRTMANGIGNRIFAMGTYIRGTISNIVTKVAGFFGKMSTDAGLKFLQITSKARSAFNAAKDAIINPIKSAGDKVKGIIDKIKGWFSGMKLKIPKFGLPPMPHFSLDYKKVDIMGKSVKIPSDFDVKWYDKGGIFNSPSIIGVGEKRPEFVGALDDLRKIVREESGVTGAGFGRIEIPLIVNGREIARAVADDIDEQLELRRVRNDRAAGRI